MPPKKVNDVDPGQPFNFDILGEFTDRELKAVLGDMNTSLENLKANKYPPAFSFVLNKAEEAINSMNKCINVYLSDRSKPMSNSFAQDLSTYYDCLILQYYLPKFKDSIDFPEFSTENAKEIFDSFTMMYHARYSIGELIDEGIKIKKLFLRPNDMIRASKG